MHVGADALLSAPSSPSLIQQPGPAQRYGQPTFPFCCESQPERTVTATQRNRRKEGRQRKDTLSVYAA